MFSTDLWAGDDVLRERFELRLVRAVRLAFEGVARMENVHAVPRESVMEAELRPIGGWPDGGGFREFKVALNTYSGGVSVDLRRELLSYHFVASEEFWPNFESESFWEGVASYLKRIRGYIEAFTPHAHRVFQASIEALKDIHGPSGGLLVPEQVRVLAVEDVSPWVTLHVRHLGSRLASFIAPPMEVFIGDLEEVSSLEDRELVSRIRRSVRHYLDEHYYEYDPMLNILASHLWWPGASSGRR